MKRIVLVLIMVLCLVSLSWATKIRQTNDMVGSYTGDGSLNSADSVKAVLDLIYMNTLGAGTGSIFYVDSGASGSATGTSWTNAVLTLDAGINLCTDNAGDVIYVAPGHAESGSAADLWDADVAGITIYHHGNGADMGTYTFADTDTTVAIGAASVRVFGGRYLAGISEVVMGISVETAADDCSLVGMIFPEPTTSTFEFDKSILVASGADRLTVRDCMAYSADAVGATNWLDLDSGVQNGMRIINNTIVGEYAEGAIHSDDIDLEVLLKDNVITNMTSGQHAIEFTANATGVIINCKTFTDAIATSIDPGLMPMDETTTWNKYGVSTYIPVPVGQGSTGGEGSDTDAIEADDLDHLIKVAAGTAAYPVPLANDSILAMMMCTGATATPSTYDNTTMSLQALNVDLDACIDDLTDIDANLTTTLADTAELQTDWVNGGRLDLLLDTALDDLTDIDANMTADIPDIDANCTLILADTGELQTDWVNGGRLDLLLDTCIDDLTDIDANNTLCLADTDELQTDWANGGRLDLIIDNILDDIVDVDANLIADLPDIDANTILILADTGELQTDWVNGGRLDLIIDNILDDIVDVDANLIADLPDIDANTILILADTGELQTDWVNGGRLDLIVDNILDDIVDVDANLIADLPDIDANTILILADTGELQTDWVNGGRLDLLLDACVDDLTDIDANMTADIPDIDANVTAVLADTAAWDTSLEAKTLLFGGTDASYNSILGKQVTRAAADIFDGTTTALFTVANGRVLITHFSMQNSTAACDATANAVKIVMNPTSGTDTDLCATLDVADDEINCMYTLTGVFADALVQSGAANSGAVQSVKNNFICDEGTIDMQSAGDSGSGATDVTTSIELWYFPIDDTAAVTAL